MYVPFETDESAFYLVLVLAEHFSSHLLTLGKSKSFEWITADFSFDSIIIWLNDKWILSKLNKKNILIYITTSQNY